MTAPFESFCTTVTAQVKNGTKQDRHAIAQELREHLEDHAAYLVEQGMTDHEAAVQSIASMGDPEEIGREMNEKYPKWPRYLHELLVGFSILLCIPLLLVLFLNFFWGIVPTMQWRYFPESVSGFSEEILPMDERWEIGTNVLTLYAVQQREDDKPNSRRVALFFSIHSKVPLRPGAGDVLCTLSFETEDGENLPAGMTGATNSISIYDFSLADSEDTVMIRMDAFGHDFSAAVTLPEQEVQP